MELASPTVERGHAVASEEAGRRRGPQRLPLWCSPSAGREKNIGGGVDV